MESPIKKLDFGSSNKENRPFESDIATLAAEIDAKAPVESIVKDVKKEETQVAVAPTIKPSEADEPLLQENPQRFVLFPIKYHEVSVASRSPPPRRVD